MIIVGLKFISGVDVGFEHIVYETKPADVGPNEVYTNDAMGEYKVSILVINLLILRLIFRHQTRKK